MNLEKRINAFVLLGEYLQARFMLDNSEMIKQVEYKNQWFTSENISLSIINLSQQLTQENLCAWITPYKLQDNPSNKKVLIIMAGNIPLVGFHDFLSVLIFGYKVVVKLSSNDTILLPLIVDKLNSISPFFKNQIEFVDNIKNCPIDAVIATGSNNSSRYFDYYFKDVKKIIRRSRRSIAILDGNENKEELKGLASDIFSYFGLGCRNISKVFLPYGYDLDKLFNVFYSFSDIINHKKYANNYDYNKAIFLMGDNDLIENGFLILKEEKSLFSPVAMLYYEFYSNINEVEEFISKNNHELQCVVSKSKIPFGTTQKPKLWDYADGVDVIDFLKTINQ